MIDPAILIFLIAMLQAILLSGCVGRAAGLDALAVAAVFEAHRFSTTFRTAGSSVGGASQKRALRFGAVLDAPKCMQIDLIREDALQKHVDVTRLLF